MICFECNKADLQWIGTDQETGRDYYKCSGCNAILDDNDIMEILKKSKDKYSDAR